MGQDTMNSIVPECTTLKHEYDKCFNKWFGTKFLKGDTKLPVECDRLFKKYQECIRPKMEEEIKLNELIDS